MLVAGVWRHSGGIPEVAQMEAWELWKACQVAAMAVVLVAVLSLVWRLMSLS